MQLVDRIEKCRFVGREFLLWLWCESEQRDATLSTKEHGTFGLWLEQKLVLSAGKESTQIKAAMPGRGREAKEALLRGQLPERTGIRIAMRDDEVSFVLKGEQLAISALKLKTVLDKDDGPNPLIEQAPPARKPKKSEKAREREAQDENVEAFYERMRLTQELEGLVEALYRDFLAVRLSSAWRETELPKLRAWAAGETVAAQGRRARTR